MALELTGYERLFKYKNGNDWAELADPNPEFTVDEVLTFFSATHTELTTATIDGPKIENGKAVYEFTTTVGTKG